MGEKIVNRDPLEEIRRAFRLFDDDGTGKINLRNLRRVAKELGENLTDDELRAMIDEFDLDDDGESMYSKVLREESGSNIHMHIDKALTSVYNILTIFSS